jgi:hypothetical protein
LEKGEVVIVGGQFLALAVLILLLGNYAGVGLGSQTTKVGTVYWGAPPAGTALTKDALNKETANASALYVYFSLTSSATVSSVSASRLCLDTAANNTGGSLTYTQISINYDSQKRLNYVTFGPVGQPLGVGCDYTVSITDSLQQTVTWTGSVELSSNSTSKA